jgi:hypothetical protein
MSVVEARPHGTMMEVGVAPHQVEHPDAKNKRVILSFTLMLLDEEVEGLEEDVTGVVGHGAAGQAVEADHGDDQPPTIASSPSPSPRTTPAAPPPATATVTRVPSIIPGSFLPRMGSIERPGRGHLLETAERLMAEAPHRFPTVDAALSHA